MALGYHIASRLHSIIGRVSTGLVHWSLGYKPLTHWISLGRTGTSGRHFFGKPRKYWTVVSLTAVPANLSSPKFFFKFSGVRPCSTWDTLPQNKQNNWMCSWVICVPKNMAEKKTPKRKQETKPSWNTKCRTGWSKPHWFVQIYLSQTLVYLVISPYNPYKPYIKNQLLCQSYWDLDSVPGLAQRSHGGTSAAHRRTSRPTLLGGDVRCTGAKGFSLDPEIAGMKTLVVL